MQGSLFHCLLFIHPSVSRTSMLGMVWAIKTHGLWKTLVCVQINSVAFIFKCDNLQLLTYHWIKLSVCLFVSNTNKKHVYKLQWERCCRGIVQSALVSVLVFCLNLLRLSVSSKKISVLWYEKKLIILEYYLLLICNVHICEIKTEEKCNNFLCLLIFELVTFIAVKVEPESGVWWSLK